MGRKSCYQFSELPRSPKGYNLLRWEHKTAPFLYEFPLQAHWFLLRNEYFFWETCSPPYWKIGHEFSACDYLPLLTVNHGLVDLYPTFAYDEYCYDKCRNALRDQHYRLDQKLKRLLRNVNAYVVKQLFNISNFPHFLFKRSKFSIVGENNPEAFKRINQGINAHKRHLKASFIKKWESKT